MTMGSHCWPLESLVEHYKSVAQNISGEGGEASVPGVNFWKPITLLLMQLMENLLLE